MFLRVVKGSFARKRQRKLIAVAAIALGASVTTAMLAVALGVGDKVNRELRSYGANIEALPRQRPLTLTATGVRLESTGAKGHIRQNDLARIKSVFWAHNILSFTPFLYTDGTVSTNGSDQVRAVVVGTWFDHALAMEGGTSLRTGVRVVSPWWKVTGNWPRDGECLVGASLAERLHASPQDSVSLTCSGRTLTLRISGLLATGAAEDEQLITGLEFVQRIAGLEGKIDRLEVSALTNPEDDLSRKDPQTLSGEEYERWTCTPYPSSIARDLETVLEGAEARPILRISQTEG
ncbi:MAG TPA: ABC transporter permease, partial [Blastocatellia bacterium]|nr:ABC transporter permease [Blastocatellia bacterium]